MKKTCSSEAFIFPFYFFHTPSENTEMLQREVTDSTWKGTKKKGTTSISTDGGYRLVAQLNRKRTATGKEIAHCRWKRQRTFAKL